VSVSSQNPSSALNSKRIIAPSILSADFSRLKEEIQDVERAGADWIHVDVMDGHFVPNLTIGPPVVAALKKVASRPLDVHLMIEQPERWVKAFAEAGADWLTIHIEATKDATATLQEIRKLNVRPGLTLRPGTPIDSLFPYLKLVDLVLIMTVEPGFGGQKFMPDQLEKVRALRAEFSRQGVSPLIEVDGGINADTIKSCAGVDAFVAGNAVFGAKDRAKAIADLRAN